MTIPKRDTIMEVNPNAEAITEESTSIAFI
jgi:hypothetical protein